MSLSHPSPPRHAPRSRSERDRSTLPRVSDSRLGRRLFGAWWLVLCVSAACGDDDPMPEIDAGAEICTADSVCDDGRFCNGAERCSPGAAGADARGCVLGEMACGAGVACDEAARECAGPCSEPDADGDGHAAIECGGDDCDDTDPDRFPSNTEICDLEGHDEDCDPRTFGLRDLDGDRIDDARCCNTSDDGTTYCGEDCDDTRRGTNPNVPEVCDGRDNDCDGAIDEDVSVAGFADTDRDLHGDVEAPISGCPGWPGVSASSLDCDDSNPTINGPQTEILDGSDNDCDERIDEEVGTVFWYRDADGDLWGSTRPEDRTSSDRPVAGYVLLPYDCDDADPSRAPSRTELCNGIDDDCDPRTGYVLGINDWEDDDGDGWADAACPGIAASRADCDDTDASTFPGGPERCDARDNDCDGRVDESCSDVPPPVDAGVPVDSGAPVDSGPPVDAGPLEPADAGVDGGIDGGVDGGPPCMDVDGDTFFDSACGGTDCNDARDDIYPGRIDACDGADNDCDPFIDEDGASFCALSGGDRCVAAVCQCGTGPACGAGSACMMESCP